MLDACSYMDNGTELTSPRCENNGNCVNGSQPDSPGKFVCECALGYKGRLCQEGLTTLISLSSTTIENIVRCLLFVYLLACVRDSDSDDIFRVNSVRIGR